MTDETNSRKDHAYSIRTIKEWRQREHDAGRPSGLDDFYRSHGLCSACRSGGRRVVGVCWIDIDGNARGSRLGSKETPTIAAAACGVLQDVKEWGYLYETCEVCGGTGRVTHPDPASA